MIWLGIAFGVAALLELLVILYLVAELAHWRRFAMTVAARALRALYTRGMPRKKAVALVCPELSEAIANRIG